MPKSIEKVYLGNDNTLDLILKEDGVAVSLASVTKMTLTFGSTIIDSSVVGAGSGNVFDWTEGSGVLKLKLGAQSISTRMYSAVKLTVFDAGNTNGIVWGTLRIKVE